MNYEEHAATLINYFEGIVISSKQMDDESKEKYSLGKATAQKWLELIKDPSPSIEEVSRLIQIVDENKYQGSGWFDLALGVGSWAKQNNFPIPYVYWPHKIAK
jgi:hypothetical protein